MGDSTSIMDLPTDPVGGGNISNNISLKASESQATMNLDQSTINQIVNSLQQASASGSTLLPSRDIPMNTNNISTDAQIQPNYVPTYERNVDYIRNYEQTNDIIDDYNRNAKRSDSLDEMYSELQAPILLAVLYFLFQLPIFRRYLFNYFPILFSNDGNLNINGFVFNSVLFGLLFYLINKMTMYTNMF
jgi:hypothetical protein